MPKTKDSPPNCLVVPAIGPFLRVKVGGVGFTFEISTKKLISVLDAFLDLGNYPIFLASATTFSLKVALSIKTSFDTMLALYEVRYVL